MNVFARIEIFQGSPQVLLYLNEEIEGKTWICSWQTIFFSHSEINIWSKCDVLCLVKDILAMFFRETAVKNEMDMYCITVLCINSDHQHVCISRQVNAKKCHLNLKILFPGIQPKFQIDDVFYGFMYFSIRELCLFMFIFIFS